jgi:hypothetical protein
MYITESIVKYNMKYIFTWYLYNIIVSDIFFWSLGQTLLCLSFQKIYSLEQRKY